MLGGLSFFFLSYRFGGVGERGGMVLLHVNGPPFFTTPYHYMVELGKVKSTDMPPEVGTLRTARFRSRPRQSLAMGRW